MKQNNSPKYVFSSLRLTLYVIRFIVWLYLIRHLRTAGIFCPAVSIRHGEIIEIISTPLASLGVNTIAKIVHIEDEPKSIYRQIIKKKLHIGSHIKIIATNNLKIIFESEGQIFEFSTVVASNINALALNEQDIYEQNKIRLSALNVGETATITGISSECRGANRRRLLDLGFIKGTPLEMEYAGPNQNPRAYKIRNTLIALRNDQADLILIEKK